MIEKFHENILVDFEKKRSQFMSFYKNLLLRKSLRIFYTQFRIYTTRAVQY